MRFPSCAEMRSGPKQALAVGMPDLAEHGQPFTCRYTLRSRSDRQRDGGGAGLGAAISAAVAAGLYPDMETAAGAMTRPRQSFAPDPANGEIYRRISQTVYHDIRSHTDALFERSYPIFH